MTLKELKKGELFTLKPVEHPRESQIYVKSDYDPAERKFWATRWSDIGDGKYIAGNREVYTEFEF